MSTHLTLDETGPPSAATHPPEGLPGMGPPHALLASLAHELRNPLGPVRNAVFLLRARVPADDTQSVWALDLIDRQVGEMAAMLEDVGDVARLWRGTLPRATEPIDLRAAVEEAVTASAASRATKQQTLDCRTSPDALPVRAERGRLTKAITHVLQAAAKACATGAALTLRLDRDGANARLYVSEAGSALLPPLSAAPGASHPSAPLVASVGMMLAEGIVELYGGSVAAAGGADDHPRFTVRLPLAAASAREAPAA